VAHIHLEEQILNIQPKSTIINKQVPSWFKSFQPQNIGIKIHFLLKQFWALCAPREIGIPT
jgi:hypothetical protein